MSETPLSAEEQRQTWQYRAISATRGNQSRLGCILLSVLGKPAKHPPWAGPSCVITADGIVLANFVNRHGSMVEGCMLGHVADLVGNFRGLADHLKLLDWEREELFAELRKWVAVDYRADENYDEIRRNIQ